MMSKSSQNTIPQESSNLSTSSDRVQAPVAGAGSMDFGGDQKDLNRSVCEELGGPLDVTERKFEPSSKFSIRMVRMSLEQLLQRAEDVKRVVKEMEDFSDTKKNMFLQIKQGISKLDSLTRELVVQAKWTDLFFKDCPRSLGETARKRAEVRKGRAMEKAAKKAAKKAEKATSHNGTQTEEAVKTPSPQYGKRVRENTLSPVEASTSMPKKKKPKIRGALAAATSTPKQSDGAGKPGRKTARKRRKKKRRARPEAVLIKPAEGLSYAEVLKDLKQKLEPDALGVQIRGVRETRKGEVLVELGPAADGRAKLSAAIRTVVGEGGSVRDLVPRTEVEVLDLDTTTVKEDVEAAVKTFFGDQPAGDIKVCLTKKAFRGNLKAFVEVTEEMAKKLVQAGHLKVGWVSCRVREKVEIVRCYRCLGFGHMAAGCKGPERARGCWRCGVEGHKSAECLSAPQCFLCAARSQRTRTDHLPGSGRCLSFRDATSSGKPPS